jgi:hypothetical protein
VGRTYGNYAHTKKPAEKQASRDLLQDYIQSVPTPHNAQVKSAILTGLQLQKELISSPVVKVAGTYTQTMADKMAATRMAHADIDSDKLAAAALAIDRLTSLVSDLHQAHDTSVKAAAALAGAVKLAQDGVIDVEDIFDTAREGLERGTVKVSNADNLFREQPGELVTEAPQSVKMATGAPIPGFSDASGQHQTADVLTATLRSLR